MIRFSYTMKVTYYASISEEELVLFAQEDGEEFSTIAEIYREEAENGFWADGLNLKLGETFSKKAHHILWHNLEEMEQE